MAGVPRSLSRAKGQALLLLLPILALVLANLLRVGGPAYRSDEIAYLASAASIAGRENALAGSWYGGYSLLLSPFFRLAPGVREAWPSVIVINGLAVMVSCLCLWRCLQRSGAADRDRGFRLLLLGLLVFGTTAYIGWAFTNCLLMALIGAASLLLAAPVLSLGQSAGIGLLLGFSTWVHPTGLLLLTAATIATLRPASGRIDRRSGAVILSIGVGMALGYSRVVHPWITALQGGAAGHYEAQIGELIRQVQDMPLATLSTLGVGVVNGLATSAIATFGYGGTALAALLTGTSPPPGSPSRGVGLRRVLLFLLISWGLLVLFSAALLPHEPTDLQLAFHQRYTQPVLPALVAFGMALAPGRRGDRVWAWLFSAVPILLALLVASVLRPYDDNFSIIDQLGAVTFFLDRENVPLMLAAGLVTTGAVQLLGWRAFLPLAAVFWWLGWQQMDRIQRHSLHGDSRPPAMAAAASTLRRAGIRPCVYLAETPNTAGEHDRLMRYYLAGEDVTVFGPGEALPRNCQVVIRPVDSEADPRTRIQPGGRPPCRALIADTFSHEVLEDCRTAATAPSVSIERLLLPAPRDLVSLERVRQLQPPGYTLEVLFHADALPPERPRDRLWWRAASAPPPLRQVEAGESLVYGPYVSLPAGRYLAVFDGVGIRSGELRMQVTSGEGAHKHASIVLGPGSRPGEIAFTLDEPQKDLEVILRAEAAGRVRLPTSLAIYGTAGVRSSPWSSGPDGR